MDKILYPNSGSILGNSDKRYTLKTNHSVKFAGQGECFFNEHGGDFSQDVDIKVEVADQHGVIVGHECRENRNCKSVDLSVLLINQKTSKVASYFYDVKDTFHGVDVITHFAQQLAENISYAQNCISAAQAFSEKISVGVLVGLYSTDRLRKSIRAKENELLNSTNANTGINLKASMIRMMNSEEAKQNSKENKSKSEEISNAKNVLNGQIRLLGKLFDLDIEAFEEISCDDFENTKERVAKDTIIHNVDIIADDVNSVRIRTLASASIK